uniref:Alpha-1,6-mannosyl-glycoprotein 6-beta-N-acetylglucosaminyltransferase n=1 Tax=Ascaris lumbricoides TaxID=6252 RepID=A0A0M3HWD7_ASCLU
MMEWMGFQTLRGYFYSRVFQPMVAVMEKSPTSNSRLHYTVITISILVSSLIFYTTARMIFAQQAQPVFPTQSAKTSTSEERSKYVGLPYIAASNGGGIGNQLFEFVSLIGIARNLNRVPYIGAINFGAIKKLYELSKAFPNLPEHFHILFPKVSLSLSIQLANVPVITKQ